VPEGTERTRAGRAAAESALIRVVHHYGARPEFVLIGGLVPELLCSDSTMLHAGTTDVDVQVNLEIQSNTENALRLERALLNAEFSCYDKGRVWRWQTEENGARVLVKFELLADLDDQPNQAVIEFNECDSLGAVNLRGTSYAARDIEVREITRRIHGDTLRVEINVTGLAGFLLAKASAAYSRRLPKDWYDLAFVLQHNNAGGPEAAADRVRAKFGEELTGAIRSALDDMRGNFADVTSQGPIAYAEQMLIDHPELDLTTLRADAVVAVVDFHDRLF
jgi:Nucleotidyl transferase AbiEii toxin, Type IV TA system